MVFHVTGIDPSPRLRTNYWCPSWIAAHQPCCRCFSKGIFIQKMLQEKSESYHFLGSNNNKKFITYWNHGHHWPKSSPPRNKIPVDKTWPENADDIRGTWFFSSQPPNKASWPRKGTTCVSASCCWRWQIKMKTSTRNHRRDMGVVP